MENFSLQSNESVLYERGCMAFFEKKAVDCDLVLTNLRFVLVKKLEKLLPGEPPQVCSYSISDIKTENGVPRIILSGPFVQVYLTDGSEKIDFESRGEAVKFCEIACQVVREA